MIAFARLLAQKHPKVWGKIEGALQERGVKYALIEGCKDIWVRDFMPLALEDGGFLSYEYNPNYLKTSPHLRTSYPRGERDLGLVLDGGNFVRFKDVVLMCEKVLSENPSQSEIISMIKERAGVERVILLPKVAYDRYGHSDAMCRWIDERTILINDFSLEGKGFHSKLERALEGYEIISLKYSDEFLSKYKWGAYLNFVEVENLLLLPTYGIDEDKKVIERFEEIFEGKTIAPIECKEIIRRGGALHCVSAEIDNVSRKDKF